MDPNDRTNGRNTFLSPLRILPAAPTSHINQKKPTATRQNKEDTQATNKNNSKYNNNKRKKRKDEATAAATTTAITSLHTRTGNPLEEKQHAFLATLSRQEQAFFFSNTHVTPERRAQIWMDQAELGEQLVNCYSWATPNAQALQIFKHFQPLVEIGCGANAYWYHWMKRVANIDIIAYDVNLHSGGQIHNEMTGQQQQQLLLQQQQKKRKRNKDSKARPNNNNNNNNNSGIRKGGPEVLRSPEIIQSKRTLFLCYPDDDDDDDGIDDNHGLNYGSSTHCNSMGWNCLHHYQGDYVIHVGELCFFDANLSIDQAPWGRSSSPEFQQRLYSEYHCLLKCTLPNWLHTRDTISVWKRSETCTIVFASDKDDEDNHDEDEEVEYRHIPPQELLPMSIAAPCLQHLLVVPPPEHSSPTQGKKEASATATESTTIHESTSTMRSHDDFDEGNKGSRESDETSNEEEDEEDEENRDRQSEDDEQLEVNPNNEDSSDEENIDNDDNNDDGDSSDKDSNDEDDDNEKDPPNDNDNDDDDDGNDAKKTFTSKGDSYVCPW